MKQAFRLSRVSAAVTALVLILGAFIHAQAQTPGPSPDSFILQVTSTTIPPVPTPTPSATPTPSPSATPTPSPTPLARNSYARDISGDGRFVVIESSGDISTEKTAQRNNADGNQEIFLFDYAQRRIFQITNTTNVLKSAAGSPIDPANIDIQIANLNPQISHDGRFIVFRSNAYSDADPNASPLNFIGSNHAAALRTDGNTEIFIYAIPAAPPVADLSSGAEVTPVDLAAGTMTRITFTPASAVPRPGAAAVRTGELPTPPFYADDNRAASINDDASYIAFVSTRNITNIGGLSNADANPEVFIYNRTSPSFIQVTNTSDMPATSTTTFRLVINDNPSLSGSGNVLAFISNADINSTETTANKGNGEVYVANFNGTTVSNLRPVTRTPPDTRPGFEGSAVNVLSPGRRVSRDGRFVAFETTAELNSDGTANGDLKSSTAIYVYNVTANTFAPAFSRPTTNAQGLDLNLRFPTFTGDSTRLVYASILNLRPDGTIADANDTAGLNPTRTTQIFSAPVATLNQISRLTRTPANLVGIQPVPSDSFRRTVFSLAGTELGGGNADGSAEAFYLLIPVATSETPAPSPTPATTPAPVSFFTGASLRPVVSASPAPTPPAVTGLAPGMLGVATSTLAIGPATSAAVCTPIDRNCNAASETARRPSLPVELGGVSVSISNAAAGLYFVGQNQINFVVPPGLIASTTALPVVINNNGAVIRTSLLINAAQPDIATTSNGAGGRAAVFNVTNPCISPTGEPFGVTTMRPSGSGTTGVCTATTPETAPTELLILLTGVRNAQRTQVTVQIGSTTLTGDAILSVGPSQTAGFDQIIVRLPPTLAGAGDVPVIVTVTPTGGTAVSSRPSDTAPRITIQ